LLRAVVAARRRCCAPSLPRADVDRNRHTESSTARRPFLASAGAERVAGGRVYDAHIAEIARLAGARLVVTDNRRHFVGLMRHGIRVLTAVEFADEHGS